MARTNHHRTPDGGQCSWPCHYGARARKHPIGAGDRKDAAKTRVTSVCVQARGGKLLVNGAVLRGTTVQTGNPSPTATKTGLAATGLLRDWYGRTGRGYGATRPLSISNAIQHAENTLPTSPPTDESFADGDDRNYGTTCDGGVGSSNLSIDIVAESETSGVSPAGRPFSFRM